MESTPRWLHSQRLIRLLTDQRDLYDKLRLLSERQRNLIAGDRPELLLNILQDRQKLVASLAQINEKLSPFRRDWNGIYAKLGPEIQSQASELLEQINSILNAILKSDQEDSDLLSARKQAVSQSLSGVAGGRAANAAYARQGGTARPGSGGNDSAG